MPILRGLTYDQYDALPGVRSTDLKRMSASPLHYKHGVDNDTANRGVLRAIHCLVLEPDAFDRDFVIFDGVRRGKVYDNAVLANEGKTLLNPREAATARATANAILANTDARIILDKAGDREVTLTWRDRLTGLECKARLDALSIDTVTDIKTYGTTESRTVGRRAWSLGAHIQGAHYADGVMQVLGFDPTVLLIVAEDKPPHDVAVFRMEPDAALAVGRSERERLMYRLAECIANDEWPGRHQGIQELDLPSFVMGDDDGDASFTVSHED